MRDNRGFTLIEIIAVLVILVITAAVGIPNVDAYIENAEQNARMTTARTIFYAAQNAMTKRFSQNSQYWEGYTADAYLIPGRIVERLNVGAPTTEQQKAVDKKLICLKLDRLTDGSRGDEPLYKLLEPYLTDKSVLSDAILIEFNRETGKVLSAFYSDDDGVTSFNYEAATDVCDVDDASLRSKRMGYFGVETTGEPIGGEEPPEVQVVLRDYGQRSTDYPINSYDFGTGSYGVIGVNQDTNGKSACYGLLTVECTLPPRSSQSPMLYTLRLSAGTRTAVVTFTDMAGQPADFQLSELRTATDRVQPRTMTEAFAHPLTRSLSGGGTGNVVAYAYEKGALTTASEVVVFVLDCAKTNFGIIENYPELFTAGAPENASLTAELIVTNAAGEPKSATYPAVAGGKTVQTLFCETGPDDEGNPVSGVGSVRHLNNIRYLPGGRYSQIKNIPVYEYDEKSRLPFVPLCQEGVGFTGRYTTKPDDGKDTRSGFAIVDLEIQSTANAGLFDTVASGAHVEGVTLRYDAFTGPITDSGDNVSASGVVSSITGMQYAGGIAAKNDGTILNCTVTGRVKSPAGDAGGVAGLNTGTIQYCFGGADVIGARSAGGVAGRMGGDDKSKILGCEVGTASKVLLNRQTQPGTPYYGAWLPSRKADYKPGGKTYAVANNANKITLVGLGNESGAGGVVGVMENGTVTYCINAAKVNGDAIENRKIGEGEEHGNGHAGGVVGYLNAPRDDTVAANATAHVEFCYNAGAVYGPGGTGGVVGCLDGESKIQTCYNTGWINRAMDGTPPEQPDGINVYDEGEGRNLHSDEDKRPNKTGGIVGFGNGQSASGKRSAVVYNCYNMQYAGDQHGGAFGVMSKCVVSNCAFLGNLYNTDTKYYTHENNRNNQSSEGLKKLTTYEMQNMTGGVFLADTFKAGRSAGVGQFSYAYPYLDVSGNVCNLGARYHRTPWTGVHESYGILNLLDTDNTDNKLTMEVLMLEAKPAQIPIVLNLNDSSISGIKIKLTQSDVDKLRKETPEPVTAYLYYETRIGDIPLPNHSYTFESVKVAEGTPEYAMGYRYKYVTDDIDWTANLKFGSIDVANIDILSIRAELRNEDDVLYDGDYLETPVRIDRGTVTFASQQIGALDCMCLDFTMVKEGNCRVYIKPVGAGADGQTVININLSDLRRTDFPQSFEDSFNGKYLLSEDGTAGGIYPFYVPNPTITTERYRLVLYSIDSDVTHSALYFPNDLPLASGSKYTVEIRNGAQSLYESPEITAP